MNRFSDILNTFSELRYVAEGLPFSSPLGKRRMLNQPFLLAKNEIEKELNKTAVVVSFLSDTANKTTAGAIMQVLHQAQDIEGTLRNLQAGMVLDDIELFEIKKFALLVAELIEMPEVASLVELAEVEETIEVLDPEHKRIPRFFIYDEYDVRLAPLRKKLRQFSTPPAEKAILETECSAIEDSIRQLLSEKLLVHHSSLHQSFMAFAELDFLLAKAAFCIQHHCCCPVVAKGETVYTGLFNMEVQDLLQKKGKGFQPVDISLTADPCIITGANMGGKTILLKSVAVAQYLFQFGFFVPAAKATIVPVEKVLCSFEIVTSTKSGLSSFATEIVRINSILQQAKSNTKLLVLLDEPAQTTNPAEGAAIVSAIASILKDSNIRSLITTHYSNIKGVFRRLNVKGLKVPVGGANITAENITAYMDYSLEENTTGKAPVNAIQVAAMLGVDEELVSKAKEALRKSEFE